MKKINLKGVLEILSEKELKNVMGGSGGCTNGADRGCWVIDCGDGILYYTACYEAVFGFCPSGGTANRC